jgi:chloramphenicol-sensitive protein RarD
MSKKSDKVIGIWYALAAFTTWGVLPLYWRLMREVPPQQILAHRISWSLLFVSFIITIQKRWNEAKGVFSFRQSKASFIVSALFLGINWFIYIWAVNTNHVVESSMGYFINPLVNVLLGVVFLKEKLTFWQGISILLALGGVSYLTFHYGKVPWIALSLAFSFGTYGLLRKIAYAGSLIGLLAETSILTPVAVVYIFIQHVHQIGFFSTSSPALSFLLAGSGIVTALPIIWFAHSVRRIPLSTVGFIQYLAPSLMLLLSVVVFKEPFTKTHMISFGLIWTALTLYSVSHTKFMKNVALKTIRNL